MSTLAAPSREPSLSNLTNVGSRRPGAGWQPLVLVAWIAVPAVLGALVGVIASPDAWYAELAKPSWNPPSWVFGPVWTLLYIAMGVAAFLVWREVGWRAARVPLGLFGAQLLVNLAWSPIFFGLHQTGWALVHIIFLLTLIVTTIVAFWRVNRWAGLLLLPYLAWVSFATALNAELWRLNS
jgi:translocator protein